MTTTQLQLRRDTTANIESITPAQGEPIYDVTRGALVLGDGATFGGRTATPFAGTWTPQLAFGGGSAGMLTPTAVGSWVQIGPLVLAFFAIALTAKGSATGAATITGLPVSCGSVAGAAVIVYHASLATSPAFEAYVGMATQAIYLMKSGSTTAAALADTDFTNASQLNGVAIYQAAQPTG